MRLRVAPSLRRYNERDLLRFLDDGRARMDGDTIVPTVVGGTGPLFDADYGGATSSGTSVAFVARSPLAQINTGRKLIVTAWRKAAGETVSVADNSTQAGSVNVYTVDVSANTAVGTVSAYILSCDVSRAILVTDTITVTFSGANATNVKSMGLLAFTGLLAGGAETTANATSTSTAADSGPTSTTLETGTVVVGALSCVSAGGATVGTDGMGNTMTSLHSGTGTNISWIDEYFVESSTAPFRATATVVSSVWEAACAVYAGPADPRPPLKTVTRRSVYGSYR
jgi:hypothetical protein